MGLKDLHGARYGDQKIQTSNHPRAFNLIVDICIGTFFFSTPTKGAGTKEKVRIHMGRQST